MKRSWNKNRCPCRLAGFLAAALILAAGVLACSDPATAQESSTPTAAQVLAESKAATGGGAWDQITALHQVSSVSTGGLSGIQEEWDDVRTGRFVIHFRIGPITGLQGFDGTRAWTTDQSGESQYQASADAAKQAVSNAYLVSMAYWYPDRRPGKIAYLRSAEVGPRSFDVIEMTPDGGYPIEVWFDAITHLIDRTVETTASETDTTYYDDFRKVAGVVLPYASRVTNGKPQYDTVTATQTADVNTPISQSQFAPPPPMGEDYDIEGGGTSVTEPFDYRIGYIFVPIELNGRSYSSILDTGGAYIISPRIASQLSLRPRGKLEAQGIGSKSINLGPVHLDRLAIGKLILHYLVFDVVDVKAIERNPIIGYELLQRLVVSIDYIRKTVTFTVPAAFKYDGNGVSVPFEFDGRTPEVFGSVDGIPGEFTIDTGSGKSLELFGPFVAANHLLSRYRPKFDVIAGFGVGGAQRASFTRAHALALGGATVNDPVTEIDDATGGDASNKLISGNIGEGVLRQFNIILDYPHQRIIFERNANWGKPDVYDRSGIVIDPNGDRAEIVDLVPGGPGERAGLCKGDVIRSVNGHMLDNQQFDAWADAIRKPVGTKLRLEVISNGAARQVTVVLRDLV